MFTVIQFQRRDLDQNKKKQKIASADRTVVRPVSFQAILLRRIYSYYFR